MHRPLSVCVCVCAWFLCVEEEGEKEWATDAREGESGEEECEG